MRLAVRAADVLRFVLPTACVACGAWVPDPPPGPLACPRCRSRLRRAPWPRCDRCHHPIGTGRPPAGDCLECRGWPDALTRARYAFVLAPPADAMVHGLKYEGWAGLAREMGRAVADAARRDVVPGQAALVVPVPTTLERVRERGYNQAGLLAAEVAATLGIPCADALIRTRGGATQVALPPYRRRANVKDAFAPGSPRDPRVAGAHVVLVDDVLTTGSTAAAAAKVLTRMGADQVTLATFVRALPFRPLA